MLKIRVVYQFTHFTEYETGKIHWNYLICHGQRSTGSAIINLNTSTMYNQRLKTDDPYANP